MKAVLLFVMLLGIVLMEGSTTISEGAQLNSLEKDLFGKRYHGNWKTSDQVLKKYDNRYHSGTLRTCRPKKDVQLHPSKAPLKNIEWRI